MRLFDIAGFVFVAIWVFSVGSFILVAHDEDSADKIALTDGVVDLQEDTSWMAVYRAGEDAGVLREDRTRLIDGWLIELQGIVELDLMGDPQVFRFTSRSTLNEDLTLRSATGDVEAFGMELQMSGQYRDSDDDPGFYVNVVVDDSSRQFVADLEERPRLSNYAIPEILSREDLEVGDRFEQDFFDPLTLAPSNIDLIYDGKEEIDTVGDRREAHNFLQSVGSFDTRIYTDGRGIPLVQILPMEVVVRRLPDQLGPSHFNDFEDVFDDADTDAPAFVSAIDADDLLALVARFGSGQVDRLRPATEDDEALFSDHDEGDRSEEAREFGLSALPDDKDLELRAYDQHVAMQTADKARVERGPRNPLWHAGHAPENSQYEPASDPGDRASVAALADDLEEIIEFASDADEVPEPIDVEAVTTVIVAHCDEHGIDDGHQCLVRLADALSAVDLAPHFAHGGAIADEKNDVLEPRVWLVLFYDGHYLGAVDPLSDEPVGRDHVQLYIGDTLRPDGLGDLLSSVEVL